MTTLTIGDQAIPSGDAQTVQAQPAAVAPVIENPTAPIIGDKVAKPLWITLALIAASAPYAFPLTVVDWSHWDATIAGQVSSLIVAWAGSVAAVLGLSRYARSGS